MAENGLPTTDIATLTSMVLTEQRKHKEASGDLTLLLTAIQFACKFVSSCVRKANLIHLTGLAGTTNVQNEDVKKLDVIANDIFMKTLRDCGKAAVLVSEENDNEYVVEEFNRGRYCVAFDPLDGSSNIDAGVNVGTIFGIWRSKDNQTANIKDILRPGREMIAAGYCMYGSSCNMILALKGAPVHGYTLDPSLGEFILTHPDIRIPDRGKIYSVNEGNSLYWPKACKEYFHQLKFGEDKKPYSARYIGSMVADIHRTLLYGGIFCYPGDKKSKHGKLRLLYECFPMSFIVEQAGGRATTGLESVLDIIPENIHQRCGIFLGSKEDVQEIEKYYQMYPPEE